MNLLQRFGVTPAPLASRIDELSAGPIRAIGRLDCGGVLRAPISHTRCAGFIYHASALPTRGRGVWARRSVLRVEVYDERLLLQMVGGTVVLEPRRSDSFASDGHRALVRRDLAGFRAKEILLEPGERVRIYGRLRREQRGWVLTFEDIVRLDR